MPTLFKRSLKNRFTTLFVIQLIFAIIMGGLIFALYQNQLSLAKSHDTQFNSYLLADELRQSSDDLTRFARAYVATGNPEFEKKYWEVLDIRNGKSLRPVEYNRIYWDLVIADGKKPRADGAAVALQSLMEKAGFTEEEFGKLALAQKNSDALVKLEEKAMNTTKGFFVDQNGEYTSIKNPDPVLANELMNGAEYFKIKADIMRPIDDFYQLFQARTSEGVQKYLGYAYTMLTALVTLFFVLFITFIYSFVTTRSQISEKEKTDENLKKQIAEKEQVEKDLTVLSKSLEAKVQERTKQLEESEKTAKAALERTEQLNALMVNREFKLMEIKQNKKNSNITKRPRG